MLRRSVPRGARWVYTLTCSSSNRRAVRFRGKEQKLQGVQLMSTDAAPFPVMSIAQCNALMTAPGAKFELEEKVINGIKLRTYKNAPGTLRDVVLNSKQW